jgi:hypothetical protein
MVIHIQRTLALQIDLSDFCNKELFSQHNDCLLLPSAQETGKPHLNPLEACHTQSDQN